MTQRAASRGQPLFVFVAILVIWTAMRVTLWTPPFADTRRMLNDTPHAVVRVARQPPAEEVALLPDDPVRVPIAPVTYPAPWNFEGADALHREFTAPTEPVEPVWRRPVEDVPIALAEEPASVRRIGSHYMLLAAGLAHMPLPPELAALYARRPVAGESEQLHAARAAPALARVIAVASPRTPFSGDIWALWRQGSGGAAAPGAASYGRSQAGAVMRYQLVAGGTQPTAFARITRAVEGPRETELAAGVSLRPAPALPVAVAAEVRASDTAAGRELRPAAFALAQLSAKKLPGGLRADGYAQAGYVGGHYATLFIDGQGRVDGRITRLGNTGELRGGVGVWGGAQRGAARLDIGPSATIGLNLGETGSRLAIDYRVRVAGQAEPKSGPALTLSAGF